jgi:predicted kinase
LRNIVLVDGHPVLFDGVEFNDDISCIDVLYDLAFLLMDLWRRRLPRHANAVWNRYLSETADLDGVALLPLFLSCRAAVRAKTSATAAALQPDAGRRQELYAQSREYLEMAGALLDPPPPALVAVGGFSGSGKSTLAFGLAPKIGAVPGALVLRSDEIRKRLLGVPLLEPLGPDGYAPGISERVYAALAERAAAILRRGHSVIVDAVHARPADRIAIERVAREATAPFVGLWLDAPERLLVDRTGQRRHDPSDADADVVRRQHAEGAGTLDWYRIDASREPPAVLSDALDCVDDQLQNAVRASQPSSRSDS